MARPKSNKPKKGFMDGYKTYDPTVEGYGDATQWKQAFNQRMGYDEAKNILSNEDPYMILEIVIGASLAEIKKAYRRMAMLWHPDRNPGVDTTEKMQKIIAAYTFLTEK
jgi:DnaJ-class molecular chaperone